MIWFTAHSLANETDYGKFLRGVLQKTCELCCQKKFGFGVCALVYVLMMVPLFILSIFLIYIKMPFDVIRHALIDLIPGIDHKKWKTYGTIPWLESTMSKTDPESINKLFKLFEQFGEALPQFFLALTYFIANYNFVWQSEEELKMFGFYTGVPSTLISIVLSAG